ncbi:hypothetical protein [Pseudobutyrivibrio sp.]
MPKKSSGNFNQNEYVAKWKKDNMKTVIGTYKKEFVEEFKEACATLGITQSEVIRNAMQDVIKKAQSSK